MKNLRNLLAIVTLTGVLIISASSANAGIIISDVKGDISQPCTETKSSKTDWGVIVQGATGVIVQGITGVIVQGITGVIVQGFTKTQTDCGIIMSD